jgi:hypothetical protein
MQDQASANSTIYRTIFPLDSGRCSTVLVPTVRVVSNFFDWQTASCNEDRVLILSYLAHGDEVGHEINHLGFVFWITFGDEDR